MGYAVASVLVAFLVGRSDRAVRGWIAGVGGLYCLGLLGLTALLLAVPDEPVTGPVAVSTASWPAQVAERVALAGLFRAELLVIVPSAVVLFLVGSRLVRAGVFEPDGRRLRARLALAGLGVAFPLNLATAFAGTDWFLVDRYLLPPVVALGLLAAVTELVARTRGGALRRSVAAVGRTALSCYVAQNVLASALCYGWGLGLAGRLAGLRPGWVVGLWLVVSGVLLVGRAVVAAPPRAGAAGAARPPRRRRSAGAGGVRLEPPRLRHRSRRRRACRAAAGTAAPGRERPRGYRSTTSQPPWWSDTANGRPVDSPRAVSPAASNVRTWPHVGSGSSS
jgi:hypothetical protein